MSPPSPDRSRGDAVEGGSFGRRPEGELVERGMLASYAHPTFGQVPAIGTPFALSGFEPSYRAGPAFDADRPDILAEPDYTPDEIADLAATDAFGRHE